MFRRQKLVVYTCLFGSSEPFNDLTYDRDGSIDFICFTDDKSLSSRNWKIVHFEPIAMDPARTSKRIKHCFYDFLQNYDASLYIDNTVRLKAPAKTIFQMLDKKCDIQMFKHPDRNCIYDEAAEIIGGGIDNKDVVEHQMKVYRARQFPVQAGLFACTMMLRAHSNEKLRRAMLEWHLQTVRYSFRDQLSFPVIAKAFDLAISLLPGSLKSNDIMEWPFVPSGLRLPRDFDALRYLDLYPDVRSSGLSPEKHYLTRGMISGLTYK